MKKYKVIITNFTYFKILSIESELTIGRSSKCNISIDDDQISRIHGKLFTIENILYYTDCVSKNGSLLNGKKLTPNMKIKLKCGDIIQIENAQLEIKAYKN